MTHTEAVSTLASERYLLDEMTESERDVFEAHYFECQECAEDDRMGALLRDGARAGFANAPHLAKVASFTPAAAKRTALPAMEAVRQAWYRSAALPWAIAATLAVMVGYQARPTSPDPASGASQALTAVTLRPASRGAAPTVSTDGSHVALALDLDAAGASEVSYEVRTEDGRVVASGQGAAPAPGSAFLIVIPTFTLTAQQQYILTVRDAGNPQRMLSDYYFTTAP